MSDLPWEVNQPLCPSHLGPELHQTQQLLKRFSRDYRAVRTSISISDNHPEFPDSEWDNIIRGRPVNLNKVLSTMYVVGADSKRIKHVSALELRIRSSAPVKKVSTQGEWGLAWDRACKALMFIFPHRINKLWKYRTFIHRTFGAHQTKFHNRIILFDQAA
ncbi:hypothetical protein K439DRAFT_1326556 [Ramaria rubella]|nr:hypothetical protein K439DRAFT_1326556 [Ramaria rubella]